MNEDQRQLLNGGALRVEEAAKFSGLSRSKLYELMDRGELEFIKLDRSRRIPLNSLIQLMAKHLRGGHL